MANELFEYLDYKKFLRNLFSTEPEWRGQKIKLAQALGCGSSFVSQVLNGHVHFSLEQAMKLNRFLGHNEDEKHYFVLLLQYNRAGSSDLQEYFLSQIQNIQKKRRSIQERIGVKSSLREPDQVIYYSSWIYTAIHILTAIPQFQTKSEIARVLQLPLELVSEVLEFLIRHELVVRDGNKFKIGKGRIHLGKDAPMISKHHANWRLRALHSLDQKAKNGTHYSFVMAISKKDAERVRSILVEAVAKTEEVVQKTEDQTIYCLGIDYFPGI